MSSKRSPQTAAKRAREQAVREKRERKEAKKLARATAEPVSDQPLEGALDGDGLAIEGPASDEADAAPAAARPEPAVVVESP